MSAAQTDCVGCWIYSIITPRRTIDPNKAARIQRVLTAWKHWCPILQKTFKYLSLCLCVVHVSSYRCVRLPAEALCHETGRQRCWRRPGRWGWPVGGPPYGTGASCPGRSPWTSRTARCGGTTGPGFKTHKTLLGDRKKLWWCVKAFYSVWRTQNSWKSAAHAVYLFS